MAEVIEVDQHARLLSPRWFRRLVRPAHERSWARAEAVLAADPLEARRVRELTGELANGFDNPVIVGRDHWWDVRPRVSDGMHRAVAAMAMGVPIPVCFDYPEDVIYDHSDLYEITGGSVADLDAVFDAVLSLASFRSATGPWIQCDIAISRNGVIELHLPRHPDYRDRIAAELEERLRSAHLPVTVRFARVDDGEMHAGEVHCG